MLPRNTAHIWRVNLDTETSRAVLSAGERRRADAMCNRTQRQRFQAGRSKLRQILGGYLRMRAGDVPLDTQRRGKPTLPRAHDWLQFNVAHTSNVGLIAVTHGASVGIDIEHRLRAPSNLHALLRRRLTAREHAQLTQRFRDHDALRAAFIRVWTRKEAFLKCTGGGIAAGLASVEVACGEQPGVVAVDGACGRADDWCMYNVEVDGGYFASMVTKGATRLVVEYRDWDVDV